MEKRVRISILLDLYGELLTDKQKNIMNFYFNEDLSLAEISEITNTSRQAIYDIIKRCEKLLSHYDGCLKLFEKEQESFKLKKHIHNDLENLKEDINIDAKIKLIEKIKLDVKNI